MHLKLLILIVIYDSFIKQIETRMTNNNSLNEIDQNELKEHALVTDDMIFPFMAAILVRSKFLSAGALIDRKWVLTAADSLFLLQEAKRTLRVRLGSINYKKGGIVVPVKDIVMHPYFDDETPSYDLAMIRLPERVRNTPTLKPIRLQIFMKEPDGFHFIVPSWPHPMKFSDTSDSDQLKSTELIKRLRLLSVTHLHPLDFMDCEEDLATIGVNDSQIIMCLDTGVMADPCLRDVGAPVVLNGLLWGIISSWTPNDCGGDSPASAYVSLVAAPNIISWIDFTIRGIKWEAGEH